MSESISKRSGRIVAIGGGKGGVGKSFVAANIALGLAAKGARTLLVDADLGGANLHTVLGVSPPLVTLSDFVSRSVSLDELAVGTPHERLRFISGALDDMSAANPHHQQKMRLLRHLNAFDTDFLVLDLGAGTSYNILDFFLLANDGILVVLPEPTSVENAYRFLKAAFLRRLKAVERVFGIGDLVAEARAQRNSLGIHTPADLMRVIIERDPDVGRQVQRQMASFRPRMVLNQVRFETEFNDAQVADDMASACRRFFGIHLEVLGRLPADDAVRRSVRRRRPVLIDAPDAPVAHGVRAIVDKLLNLHQEQEQAA